MASDLEQCLYAFPGSSITPQAAVQEETTYYTVAVDDAGRQPQLTKVSHFEALLEDPAANPTGIRAFT